MKENDGSKTICRPHLIYYLLDFGCTVIYLKSPHTKVTHKHTHTHTESYSYYNKTFKAQNNLFYC